MNASKNNMLFEYLFRDTGNYKEFGQLIFSNPNNLNPSEATSIIKRKLIDKEYFYPLKAGVPNFNNIPFGFETNWYEFVKFADTMEKATEELSIDEFLSRFKAK